MRFQSDLRKSKQIVRGWVRANFSDQKLASVVAFNADGKMSFRNPCGCLMGVTYSDRLHEGHDCNREHYWIARRQDLAQTRRFAPLFLLTRIGKAEKAYNFLGFSPNFTSCFGDDQIRRRHFLRFCAPRCVAASGSFYTEQVYTEQVEADSLAASLQSIGWLV